MTDAVDGVGVDLGPDTGRVIWKSAGLNLLAEVEGGRLRLTEDFMRAYYTRPEIHPIEDSCPAEHDLFKRLMDQPFCALSPNVFATIADRDVADNYRAVLAFRDHLMAHDTLEAAYVGLFGAGRVNVAPVLIDQLVHVLVSQMLRDSADPFRARAAEPFFREQKAMVADGQLMLADAEHVDSHKNDQGAMDPMSLAGLADMQGDNARAVSMDVMTRATANNYWARADRFDMVMDMRVAQPACDAFARNLEAWIQHLLGPKTRIQPMPSIHDEHWSWHVGLDTEATRLLNALYQGVAVDAADQEAIIGLFRLDWLNPGDARPDLADNPVYLGLAKRHDGGVRMKPQNLLTSLPLRKPE